MRVRVLLLSVAVITCMCAGDPACSARAQDASSAKTFVESLYKFYAKDGKGVPSSGPHANRYYHSSLLTLMRADEKAVKGEVGALDGDPICSCQDWEGVWDLKVDLRLGAPNRAIATVFFALTAPQGRRNDDLRHLTMTLVPESGQWRIWNVRDESDPKNVFDVREALQRDIRQATKK